MEIQTNPLKSYFRKPGIFIKLPSKGNFYTTPPKDLNNMGEIPIYPMTAKDELLLKNADALLNGTAIYRLITSCAPSILDAESMPSIDLDVILLAIRRCSYGTNMDVSTIHQCDDGSQTDNEHSINLDHFISTINTVENDTIVEVSEQIKVYVKPITVKNLLHLNWIQYEQIRNLQIAEQSNRSEKERLQILESSYEILTEANIKIVSDCIDTVVLPDGVIVTDTKNIREWITDLDNTNFKKIEKAVTELGESGLNKKFQVSCKHCEKNYETTLNLNPTTFFG